MIYYSYENFRDDTRKLIGEVSGFEPEVIVAVARGGLTLAHAMAEGLGIRAVESIRTELYDNDVKREGICIFGECDLLNKKRVLVVDDIADSGDTLEAIMQKLQNDNPQAEFKTATLFYKKTSIHQPDFTVNEAPDWIDFFWERDFK
ncbi:phosphoribosyltransferase family protein [Sulfurimonas sp. HSL-1716]|uniref:phosphoribosyltransferase n=1 Tax=Hydrocurvibacter sulfurireducens TaxID=3131937 RepID=UPI0031F9DA1E